MGDGDGDSDCFIVDMEEDAGGPAPKDAHAQPARRSSKISASQKKKSRIGEGQPPEPTIKLRVEPAGPTFQTRASALRKGAEFFDRLLEGRDMGPSVRLDGPDIVLTRDCTTLGCMLRFFESGDVAVLPKDMAERRLLLGEARYYSARVLVSVLSGHLERTETIGEKNVEILRVENEYRNLFAQDRSNPKLNDPLLTLVSVFGARDGKLDKGVFDHRFFHESGDSGRFATLLEVACPRGPVPAQGPPVVPSLKRFQARFEAFADPYLGEDFNFSNVMIAGGSVLRALLDPKNFAAERGWDDWSESDIDLFLYGLTEKEADQKLIEIEIHLRKHCAQIYYARSKGSLTFAVNDMSIQVILRLYKSKPEVLMSFDLDCCAVGYDGGTVWALPRAVRALNGRFNLVDETRPNVKYEARLYKYARRGFAVGVPGMRPDRLNVSSVTYTNKLGDLPGLGKLLRAECQQITNFQDMPHRVARYRGSNHNYREVAIKRIFFQHDPCKDLLSSTRLQRETLQLEKTTGDFDADILETLCEIRDTDLTDKDRLVQDRREDFESQSWYEDWRMAPGSVGWRMLLDTVYRYEQLHRWGWYHHGGDDESPQSGLLSKYYKDRKGWNPNQPFCAPVILATSLEDVLSDKPKVHSATSVSAKLVWHVADPTRKYVGGFTAEGMDFYGETLLKPDAVEGGKQSSSAASTWGAGGLEGANEGGDEDVAALKRKLAAAQEELATLKPQVVTVTDADSGSEAAEEAQGGGPPPSGVQKKETGMFLLAQQQESLVKVKVERDESMEEMHEEGKYSALFIDKLQQKLDALKLLLSQNGVDSHTVEQALAI